MSLLISLRSESGKIKKSAAFYTCFIIAAIVPLILFFDLVAPDDNNKEVQPMSLHEYFDTAQQVFNFVFLPLFIILISTLLLQLEYRNNTWKQVLTSPQKIKDIFLSKFITLHLLITLFIASFLIFLAIGALVIDLIHPNLFQKAFSIEKVLLDNWQAYLSILGLSALQFWLALRFKNFIASLAIGFCLWFLAPLMIFSLNWPMGDYYPYSFPLQLVAMSDKPGFTPNIPLIQLLSIGYAVIFLVLAFIEFSIRKVKL